VRPQYLLRGPSPLKKRVNVNFVSNLVSGFLWVAREVAGVISVILALKMLSGKIKVRKFERTVRQEEQNILGKPVREKWLFIFLKILSFFSVLKSK
jgi:hypothetical protein